MYTVHAFRVLMLFIICIQAQYNHKTYYVSKYVKMYGNLTQWFEFEKPVNELRHSFPTISP